MLGTNAVLIAFTTPAGQCRFDLESFLCLLVYLMEKALLKRRRINMDGCFDSHIPDLVRAGAITEADRNASSICQRCRTLKARTRLSF